jgi:hypothetical protein
VRSGDLSRTCACFLLPSRRFHEAAFQEGVRAGLAETSNWTLAVLEDVPAGQCAVQIVPYHEESTTRHNIQDCSTREMNTHRVDIPAALASLNLPS